MPRSPQFIPESPDAMTPEWLTQVLREEGSLATGRVTSVRHEILGVGEGFLGVLARLALELDGASAATPRTLIAKLPTAVPRNRAMGEMLGAYEREVLFYDELAAAVPLRVPRAYFAALDRDRASERQEQIVGAVDRLPRWLLRGAMALGFWAARHSRRRYALLLEDLAGLRAGDQVAGASPGDCARALTALARAHAALWESAQLEGPFYLTRQEIQARSRHTMFRECLPAFTNRFAALMADGLGRITRWLESNGAELARRLHREAPRTLIHGDFRLDNLFFDDADPKDPVVVVDWQLAGRGAGAYDVAYLVGGALEPEVSRSDEEELLRGYHAALVGHGVRDYPLERLRRDYQRALVNVLQTMATADAGGTTVELGGGRGALLLDRWITRLYARTRSLDLDALLA